MPSRRRAFQGVTAFVGLPGSGKTYSLAEVGIAYLNNGSDVWCNAGFDLRGANVYSSFNELALIRAPECRKLHARSRGVCDCKPHELPCACILIDEAQLYFNARKWQEFPDGFLYMLSQVRKFRVHLYFTSLFWNMVDVNLRNMTYWVWECQAGFRGRSFVRRRFPPEERRQKDERAAAKHRVKVRTEVASFYDTFSLVAVAERKSPRERELASWATGGGAKPALPAESTNTEPAAAGRRRRRGGSARDAA